jgi:hypothetical protein
MNDKAAFRQLGDEVRAVSFIVFYEENANATRSADIGGRICGALLGVPCMRIIPPSLVGRNSAKDGALKPTVHGGPRCNNRSINVLLACYDFTLQPSEEPHMERCPNLM